MSEKTSTSELPQTEVNLDQSLKAIPVPLEDGGKVAKKTTSEHTPVVNRSRGWKQKPCIPHKAENKSFF